MLIVKTLSWGKGEGVGGGKSEQSGDSSGKRYIDGSGFFMQSPKNHQRRYPVGGGRG